MVISENTNEMYVVYVDNSETVGDTSTISW